MTVWITWLDTPAIKQTQTMIIFLTNNVEQAPIHVLLAFFSPQNNLVPWFLDLFSKVWGMCLPIFHYWKHERQTYQIYKLKTFIWHDKLFAVVESPWILDISQLISVIHRDDGEMKYQIRQLFVNNIDLFGVAKRFLVPFTLQSQNTVAHVQGYFSL